jgi:cephalosporin hydroxylase
MNFKTLLASARHEVFVFRQLLRERTYISPRTEREVVDAFHKLFVESGTWNRGHMNTRWMGVPLLKCPFDLWVYQELFHRLRPDLIVECGTAHGGSALYFASLCDLLGNGRIISVDIDAREDRPKHERITYVHGSSTDPEIVGHIRSAAESCATVLVILDSDHTMRHVSDELQQYKDMVTVGSYMIVEDSNVNGHPIWPDFGPGPMEAITDFVASHPQYVIDKDCEKYYLTFNPSGYLRRVS